MEIQRLVKRYGDKIDADGLDFTAQPGAVTGFLGSNGAGKSTTMRMIVGLDAPTSGPAGSPLARPSASASPRHRAGWASPSWQPVSSAYS